MASNTENLQLYKKDPLTDGNDTFDIETMMNENWDKIEEQLGAQIVASPDKTPVSLVSGQQVIQVPRVTPYNVMSIKGLTLVNLLGRDGGFESASRYFAFQSATDLITSDRTSGTSCLKVTVASGFTLGAGATIQAFSFKAGKKYIFLGDVKNGNATSVQIQMTTLQPSGAAVIPPVTATKWTTIYKKFSPSADTSTSGFNAVVNGAAGTYGYFDSCRIYEISDAEYAALDSLTPEQVAAKYPYVDDVKPINTPYVIKYGENLVPPFYGWTLDPNSVAVSPYSLSFNATAGSQASAVLAPALPNTTYTFSGFRSGRWKLEQLDSQGVYTTLYNDLTATNGTLTFTFTTAADCVGVKISAVSAAAAVYTFTNPVLNLGDTALPFKPRDDDYLIFPARLHANIDRSVYDEITHRDGQYWKNSCFKEMGLDGGLNWVFSGDFVGYKEVKLSGFQSASYPVGNYAVVNKYDGKIVNRLEGAKTSSDQFGISTDLFVTIADLDSGWGESYQPTAAEIQAYFNGWRMTTQGVNSTVLYDRTDGQFKQWYPVKNIDGSGYVLSLPTTLAGSGYTPYKLVYQLTAPTTEVLAVEGGITLHEGLNQLEVGAGMVVREKANPFYYTSDNLYYINNKNLGASAFKYRTARIMAVYRNATEDKVWTFNNGIGANTQQGFTAPTNYDPAAAYTITYLALDQYLLTGTVQTIDGEYSANLKTTVDILSHNQANILSRVSVLESQKAGKEQPQWITPTLLNGWVAVPGREPQYRRLTDGTVETRGAVKNGTMNAIVFMFLPGYRPGIQTDVPAYSYNGMSDIFGSANIYPAGGFVANAGSNTFFSIATRFSAEK